MASQVRRAGVISAFPLLAIILFLYNMVVFGYWTFGTSDGVQDLLAGQFTMTLISKDVWHVSLGDMFLIASLVLLFFEFIKSSGTETPTIVNHALSFAVFVIALIEFITVAGFGNSTFFLFTLITLIDVVAGFITTIVSARRDFGGGGAPLVTTN